MEILNQNLSKIKIPCPTDRVYKDECAYSFDNPESPDGLYVCMHTFLGLGKKQVERYYKNTKNAVFLRIRRTRKEIPKADGPEEVQKPTKMAIGVEGGFQANEKKFEFVDKTTIVVMPTWQEIPLTKPDLPEIVTYSATGIIAAEDAWKAEEAAAMAGTWEGEKLMISKHAANLVQLDNGKKIPPRGWRCERCDLTTNLWLNLTDGAIMCGRRFFDGSGGNNHGVEYYRETGYPLAVKLGTITPKGADVYSYDEDDMVEDPNLAVHLAHFGINIHKMEKTDKTMVELEIDANESLGFEWDVIQESGSALTPLYGPGYTGMRNLGNSCYLNSVMQVLFTLPDFKQRYFDCMEEIFQAAPTNAPSDFNAQMAKLGHGLLSGEYSQPPVEGVDRNLQPPLGVRPQMFKMLVGRGHPEFSTKRQQDAQEFLLHICSLIERNSRHQTNPVDAFRFRVEERVQCVTSKGVRYTMRDEICLGVPVVESAMLNPAEVAAYEEKKKILEEKGERIDPKEVVRPRIPLLSCLEAFAAEETVADFYSSALKAKSLAHKSSKLATFPDFLFIQVKKFTVGEDWVPKKLDVSLIVPDIIDLSSLKGHGLQPGETELPQDAAEAPAAAAVQIDSAVLSQMVDMGFPEEGCKKAIYHTGNSGLEPAMQWVMEHMEDPDFGMPFQPPGAGAAASAFVADEGHLAMIMSMGFTRDQANVALKNTNNDVERAVDWIFSHGDEPMETEEASNQPSTQYRNGSSKYQLAAFISHMGTSTSSGHYVCHIRRDGQWAIFNDEKVARSEHPPQDLAYIYLYQRM